MVHFNAAMPRARGLQHLRERDDMRREDPRGEHMAVHAGEMLIEGTPR